MRTDKFSKTNLILYVCGLIPVIWLALLVAPYLDGGLVEIIKNLSVAFSNPFNISFCEDSVKTVLIFILAYALGIGIYLSND
ncbi:MAG: type IV secretory system conjugative DNA transfer family protein, partial [Clostridia bacterium]|nr:type IV secretory system conjugative DNA transfer family protein [Clostridia bacterium]